MSEYSQFVKRYLNPEVTDRLILSAMGLAGEVGEFVDLVKKIRFQGHALIRNDLLQELGDVRFYFEIALRELSATIEEVEQMNISKLLERYPNGFEVKRSVHRTK